MTIPFNLSYNLTEKQMKFLFFKEPLDIWINSFGGVRSNYIRNLLKREYKTYNAAYEYKACHYQKPFNVVLNKMAIFVYVEDLGTALTSQTENRDMFHNFQKIKHHNDTSDFSFDRWIDLIDVQIHNWTKIPKQVNFPILLLNSDKLIENKNNFESLFGVSIQNYLPRRSVNYSEQIKKHAYKIRSVNNKLKNLPDFKII